MHTEGNLVINVDDPAQFLQACELVYANGNSWAWGRMSLSERKWREHELRMILIKLSPMLSK